MLVIKTKYVQILKYTNIGKEKSKNRLLFQGSTLAVAFVCQFIFYKVLFKNSHLIIHCIHLWAS